jgi:hypothetical protein
MSHSLAPLGIKTYQVAVLSKQTKDESNPATAATQTTGPRLEARRSENKIKEWSEPAAEERKDGDERHSLKRSRFFTSPSEGQEESEKNGRETR